MSRKHLTGDWDRVKGNFKALVNFDFEGLHKEMASYVLERSEEHFEKEEGPGGEKWEPSLRAKEEGGKTLQDSRRLKRSLTFKATRFQAQIGTNDIRARVHNDGLKIKAKSAKALVFKIGDVVVKRKTIQAKKRTFVGLDKGDVKNLRQIVNDNIGVAIE